MQGVVIVDLKSEKNGQFATRNIRHLLADPTSKIVDKISSFCETSDGTLWLGSNGYGLYKRVLDENGDERFEVLTQENGLVYNGVKGIVEDRNGRLWITTQNGLSVYDPKLQAFTNYSQYDGLISPHFYWNSAVKDAAGNICLGSEAGLIEMLDDNSDTHYHGHLTFTHLMVDNQEAIAGSDYLSEDISVANTIWLKEGHRSFSIDFSALDYGYEMQGVYSYRMKGLDNDWEVLKPGQHSVRYSALPAGNYTFEVKYKSVQMAGEGDTISIEVVVKPYFWRSWWFRLLLGILFVVLMVYLYNRWVTIVKRREAEQLITPIRKVLEESDDPRQLQSRIQNILDNQERYKQSVTKSVEADKEEQLKSTRPFMERVMEIMETHYMDSEFGVQEFCDALGMSRSVASKHLNAEAGLPVGQFIRNYRLNMAKEMLSSKTTNRNITEIAYAVGFNDPKYFTRCFTKMYGVNPSSWS
jgi:AraC-like DNA-binding protein